MTSESEADGTVDEAEVSDPTAAGDPAVVDDDAGFIEPVAMEDDEAELFAGDRGTLDPEVRTVLVRLLQRKFLLAEKHPRYWRTLLEHQSVVESRLHDLFVRLVVDHERGIAYKQQVRSEEREVPKLLRDDPYNRTETLVLVHLRSVYQHEAVSGETSARADLEEIVDAVMTYFDVSDNNLARPQKQIRDAVGRLVAEGLIDEESAGRYRITPLVEIVLDNARLAELAAWLDGQKSGPAGDVPRQDTSGSTAADDDGGAGDDHA